MTLFKAFNKHLKGEADFSGNIKGVCPLTLVQDTIYKNRFCDKPAYIVGRGPSLQYLKPDNFESWSVPIICVNNTIITVSKMGLPNPLFFIAADRPSDYYIDQAENIDRIVKVFPHVVAHFYKQYKNVYVIEAKVSQHLTLGFAIHLAYYMGCELIDFVACDAFFGIGEEKYIRNNINIKKEISSPYTVSLPKENN
jgi:hypothetical protein